MSNLQEKKNPKQVHYGPTVTLLYYVSTVTVSSLTACGIGVCWVYFFISSVWLELAADFFLTVKEGEKEENGRRGDLADRAASVYVNPFPFQNKTIKNPVYSLLFGHLHTPTVVFFRIVETGVLMIGSLWFSAVGAASLLCQSH